MAHEQLRISPRTWCRSHCKRSCCESVLAKGSLAPISNAQAEFMLSRLQPECKGRCGESVTGGFKGLTSLEIKCLFKESSSSSNNHKRKSFVDLKFLIILHSFFPPCHTKLHSDTQIAALSSLDSSLPCGCRFQPSSCRRREATHPVDQLELIIHKVAPLCVFLAFMLTWRS